MKWKITDPHTRLYLIAAAILLLGVGSAVLIYVSAGDAADGVAGYRPEDSKMYRHDLELYGGKANVLADDLMRWFAGLWQGRTLAFTVAFVTMFVFCGLIRIAANVQADAETAARDDCEK
jgi:hypothetical protein